MKLLSKLLPLILFYLTYTFSGYWIPDQPTRLIIAACVMAISSTILYLIQWIIWRKVEKMETVFLILLLIFAGAAIIFQNPVIYQWKPTVLFGLMALVLLGNAWFYKKSLMAYMMASNIKLPEDKWLTVDYMNAYFFIFMALLNVVILKYCDINTWAFFKVPGSLILSFVFVIIMSIYMAKHMEQNESVTSDQ